MLPWNYDSCLEPGDTDNVKSLPVCLPGWGSTSQLASHKYGRKPKHEL